MLAVVAGVELKNLMPESNVVLAAPTLQLLAFAVVMSCCSLAMGVYTSVFKEGLAGMVLPRSFFHQVSILNGIGNWPAKFKTRKLYYDYGCGQAVFRHFHNIANVFVSSSVLSGGKICAGLLPEIVH